MPKCEKLLQQNKKPTMAGDYPNKGKLGDMGPDPRMYRQPVRKTGAAIAVSMALGAGLLAAKLR